MTVAARPNSSLRLRGKSLLAFVLSPEGPLDAWMEELDAWLARSSGFFVGRPVLLDVSSLKLDREALAGLLGELRRREIRIMGVEGTDASLLDLGAPPPVDRARQAGMAEVLEGALRHETSSGAAGQGPLIVDGPVRSGQRIVHPHGDVTVTGAIGSGAEVVAGGSIYVFGALRGRAIAGTDGEPKARILCTRLEAEFLSIDGLYRTADDLDPAFRGRPVQVCNAGEELEITPLN